MNKLERIFSKDSYLEDDNECIFDLESSKSQIPFNKAFLSLALVEPQRTISFSLDELDRCIINKANLVYSSGYLESYHAKKLKKKVDFDDSPNMYSLSTISEQSDSILSPLPYYPRKGSLEVALETMSSTSSGDIALSDLESEDYVTEVMKSVSVDETVETISDERNFCLADMSPKESLLYDEYQRPDEDLSFPKDIFLQLRKVPSSDEMIIFHRARSEHSAENSLEMSYLESPREVLTANNKTAKHKEISNLPKSILKKRGYEMAGLHSEPITRRHTTVPSQFFGREIKSVSNVGDSPRKIFPPKQKKHSAPARMPLTKLKSVLKINRKFLNSLQQTDNCSQELIDLLIKQAEILNEDIKYTILMNGIKYGSIAVLAVLATCISLRYCIKNKRCD